jgi:RNA polymerase sigma-70 factor (ECF subfamily)
MTVIPARFVPDFSCKPPAARASNESVSDGSVGGGCVEAEAAALARGVATGHADAFDRLVADYQPRVERLAHRLLSWRSASDVDDVVQDVFLAALTHATKLRGERGAWAWLATVTVNACRTSRRKAWVREKFLFGRGRREAEHAIAAPSDVSAESRETLDRVRQAIDRLGARDREVIVLHCLEGMRLPDVAEVLGISNNAVQVRLHRARQRLKTELEDDARR